MSKSLQPCEAHIPYVLQFMMDFNLQGIINISLIFLSPNLIEILVSIGMNFIHLRKASARRIPDNSAALFGDLPPSQTEPSSTCELEIDCSAADILNSLEVQGIDRGFLF